MKKRIISLILVVVMAVLALAGCAYSYAKDDMSNYATFDKAAFLAALTDGKITITDGTFGTDSAKRDEQVLDNIFTTIAKNAGTDNKVTEGVAGKYDVLYYCYYATDANGNVFYASKMAESSLTNFQFGLSTVEGLNEKIAALFAGVDVKDYIYTTVTADKADTADVQENKTTVGDTVYVSYTKEFSQIALDKDGKPMVDDNGDQITETKKVTVAYQKVEDLQSTDAFEAQLVNRVVGETNTFDIIDATLNLGSDEKNTVKYTGVKVHWIVDNEKEIGTVTHTPYTSSKEETNVFGDKVQLKDVELTYHIFPVYLIGVGDEVTAELVLEYFYSSLVATEEHSDDEEHEDEEEHKHPYVFDSLENGGFKNGEKTLAELVEELVTKRSDLSTAEKDRDTAQSNYDKATGEKKSEKEALDEAKEKVTKLEGEVKALVESILGCTNDADDDVKAALVADLKDYQYDSLEKTYKNEIKQNLAKEVYALAEKYITYKTDEDDKPVLPWKAVYAAYDRIENNHKYDFYEGSYSDSSSSSSTSSSTESNYKHYNGNFNEYLLVQYFGTNASKYTMQDVYDKMGAEAEQSVRDIILVYTLVEIYNEEKDLSVTDKQIDDFKLTYLWYFYGSIMVEDDYKTALLFDNLMNYILEENEEAEGNKVEYVRVKYDFKAEDAEESEK